jgi:hypothetical protein
MTVRRPTFRLELLGPTSNIAQPDGPANDALRAIGCVFLEDERGA